ncbi:MAG TPA: glycosyltransferase [Sphingomonas sp.]|nr:glycosyltransferase [Sphingomonas sp.]
MNARAFPSLAVEHVRARHIAIILHDFAGGGTERVMVRLANAWAERGRLVTILCGSEQGPTRALVGPYVRVVEMRPAIPRGPGSRRRLGRAVAEALPRMGAHILVGPGNFHLPVLAAIGRSPVPMVCKLSNPLDRRGRGLTRTLFFAWRMRRRCGRLAALIAMSPALAREARPVVGRTPLLCVGEPNVEDDAVARLRRPSRHAPRILCAGRLVAQKRTELAIRAFAALDRPEARLTIAGDGPDRGKLEALARSLGLAESVRFAGHVPDIAPLLEEADLLLSTSLFEGYPAVLVEAIAAGVPVVTTPSTPALPEILAHPSFGRIAAPEPQALAAAMLAAAAAPGPEEAPLAAFLDRHRRSASAEAWLAVLDGLIA